MYFLQAPLRYLIKIFLENTRKKQENGRSVSNTSYEVGSNSYWIKYTLRGRWEAARALFTGRRDTYD